MCGHVPEHAITAHLRVQVRSRTLKTWHVGAADCRVARSNDGTALPSDASCAGTVACLSMHLRVTTAHLCATARQKKHTYMCWCS